MPPFKDRNYFNSKTAKLIEFLNFNAKTDKCIDLEQAIGFLKYIMFTFLRIMASNDCIV